VDGGVQVTAVERGMDPSSSFSLPVADQRAAWFVVWPPVNLIRTMSASYLEKLNREQRFAVEHGVGTTEADDNRALLILAGATRDFFCAR
jgi:cation diffusion facilitator CzcD-associated flavoprotein CzcO